MTTLRKFDLRLLLRTSAFQVTLVYAALFVASVLILFGVLYWATVGSLSRQIDATIETEILGLAEQYERRGLDGLVDVLTERVYRTSDSESIYLFADSNLRPIAGNLKQWPTVSHPTGDRIEIDARLSNGDTARFRAIILTVGPNYRLLVGRSIRELAQLFDVFESAGLWSIGSVLLLALAGGVFMAMSAQGRIAVINRTTRRIIDGDLSGRIPVTGVRDEYHDLAVNINEMLTQIEILLENVRHVGDSVAHDLKTPLTRLRNRLESLSTADAPLAPDLRKCVAEADRLLATFAALLRIARIESGAYRKEFALLDLTAAIEGVCDLYRAVADEKEIDLILETSKRVSICGDRELLTQAFANLLDNAIKYTPNGGQVEVTVNEYADRVDLRIRDNGPGVPSSEHLRIQQRFVRLDSARSEPGNGLGLSLVRAIAEQHKGVLLMYELNPGFEVSLELPRRRGEGA